MLLSVQRTSADTVKYVVLLYKQALRPVHIIPSGAMRLFATDPFTATTAVTNARILGMIFMDIRLPT